MWDTLTGYLYMYGKFIAVLYSVGIAIYLIRPFITRRVIRKLMDERIRKFSFATSDYIWPKLTFEAEVIVRNIIMMMNEFVEEQKQNIKKHASEQGTLLYCCKFYLPISAYSDDLWKAMDYVKQLFYATHGVHLRSLQEAPGDVRRNNIDLSLILPDGSVVNELSLINHRYQCGDGHMPMHVYLKSQFPDLEDGVVVCVQMSIVSSLTSKVYDYRRHIAALSH